MPQLGARPNLLILRTLSKLGLAGIRLGYLAGAAAWIAEFDKVRPPYNVNVLTLAAADFMLDHMALLDAQATTLRAERARMFAALRTLAGVVAFESAANFVLVRVGDADGVYARVKDRGILVKNVSRIHPQLAGCLRITVGAPSENDALIDALKASLNR
jgi:histidinol-phosphate aminotransferase